MAELTYCMFCGQENPDAFHVHTSENRTGLFARAYDLGFDEGSRAAADRIAALESRLRDTERMIAAVVEVAGDTVTVTPSALREDWTLTRIDEPDGAITFNCRCTSIITKETTMSFRSRMLQDTGTPMPRWLYLLLKPVECLAGGVALAAVLSVPALWPGVGGRLGAPVVVPRTTGSACRRHLVSRDIVHSGDSLRAASLPRATPLGTLCRVRGALVGVGHGRVRRRPFTRRLPSTHPIAFRGQVPYSPRPYGPDSRISSGYAPAAGRHHVAGAWQWRGTTRARGQELPGPGQAVGVHGLV
jgi:hypothetical protein